METEIKSTVAMEPRRLASAVSAHQSGPAAEHAGASSANRTGKAVLAMPRSAEGVSSDKESGSAGLEEAVRELNGYVQNVQRNLQFNVDEDSGHTVIRVVDSETDEVIRQIPSEEVLALAKHLRSLSEGGEQGLLLKEKV